MAKTILVKIPPTRQSLFLLLIILALAAYLRLRYLRQPLIDAFSWRQASTAMMAYHYASDNWNILYPAVHWNGPEPSYQGREFQTMSYLTALLSRALGLYDWVGRGVAVAFGLWGIFALYQLVYRVAGQEEALATAAVMTLLPGSIFIERSLLPDPAMVALVVTSCWLLVAYFQTDRAAYLVLAVVAGAWGGLTKIPGLIVGIPMLYAMIAILWQRHALTLRKIAIIALAALFVLLPVIAYYLWARHLALTYPPYHFAGEGNWLWDYGFGRWWDNHFFVDRLRHHFLGWIWGLPVLGLVLLGLIALPVRRPVGTVLHRDKPGGEAVEDSLARLPKAPYLFHWWLLACLLYYLIGAAELVQNPWNFHIINPAAAALAGSALVMVASAAKRIGGTLLAAVVFLFPLFSILYFGQIGLSYMYYPYAQRSYQMGLALRQITEPDDLVVTIAEAVGDPIAIFYSQRYGWTFPPAWPGRNWGQLPADEDEAIALFEELRAQDAAWFALMNEHYEQIEQEYPRFAEHIEESCELAQEGSGWAIYHIHPASDVAKQ